MAGNSNSGRRRKPTASLKLYGNYREDRHGKRDDERLATGSPKKLVGMSPDAKHVFDLVVKSLPEGTLAQVDGPMLAGMSEMFAMYWSIHREMKKSKALDPGAFDVAVKAWRCFMAAASHFGMSPTSRAKFERAGKEAGEDLESFMNQAQ